MTEYNTTPEVMGYNPVIEGEYKTTEKNKGGGSTNRLAKGLVAIVTGTLLIGLLEGCFVPVPLIYPGGIHRGGHHGGGHHRAPMHHRR